jgi:N-acetylglucosaminyldiphosphoundecaprenol N-acetyl-beta-D-mannosaminyltransferase
VSRTVSIFGVNVSALGLEETIKTVERLIDNHSHAIVTHVHITGLNIAYEQPWFRDFLNHSALVYCDGMGVKLGALLTGQYIPERFTLGDWIWPLAALSEKKGYRWFFLGNPAGSADSAARLIQEKHPNLAIVGTQHGFFDKSRNGQENRSVIQKINQTKADLLFVGLGMPAQEKWLLDNWQDLHIPVAITCGGLFDVLTGTSYRGPAWMHQNYMEWLARLVFEPKRYGHRYLHDVPLYFFRILKQSLLNVNSR